ncbi:MAG TPA: ECF transporter S component [Bacillota bacterium]|jgi:riboflavin transporter FmnP|nr:ECF transporter S component [Bacillota bacterium]NLU55811.1 ECF transporter S component [Bacillota bacterium]HOJ46327.1 ECF transporter S component [Bacillota bacterium]HQD78625.1 ECF transporter S component [Bacillota bacterium]
MNLKKLATMSVLVALSIVFTLLIRIPFPPAPFLIYEPGDVPILVGGLCFGPVAALAMTVTASVLMGFFHPEGGVFGVVMHIIATGLLTVIPAMIYKGDVKSARKGLILGALAMSGIMPVLNVILNPIFYGMPRASVVQLLLPGIIPFNLIKASLNAAIAGVLVPRVLPSWKRSFVEAKQD